VEEIQYQALRTEGNHRKELPELQKTPASFNRISQKQASNTTLRKVYLPQEN
jgi:hypothetical protein